MMPAYNAYKAAGMTRALPDQLFYEYTGVDGNRNIVWGKTTQTVGLILAGVIGHKVAGRLGLNKYVKKATLGYFTL